jgi:arginine exporter protein ArgO
MEQVQGVKRFIVTLLSIIFLFLIDAVLLYLIIDGAAGILEILPIISYSVLSIGAIAGAYLGVQSITDYIKNKTNGKPAQAPEIKEKGAV